MAGRASTEAEPLLAIVGPTASGKTEAALEVAQALGAEIVSVDSATVYRGMDVGTAKPTLEQRGSVPHHLIDVAEPPEPFTVARYQQLAHRAIDDIRSRGHRVLLVGGSGLYMRAIADDLSFPPTDPTVREDLHREAAAVGSQSLHRRLEDLDPVAAARIEPANVRRTVRALEVAEITGRPFSSFAHAWDRYPNDRLRAAGVQTPRPALADMIERRVRAQVGGGFLDEVRGLVDRGLSGWLLANQVIGYAELARHLQGELDLQDAIARTCKRTRALARRQLAWFRRDPRIRWFEAPAIGATALVAEMTEHLHG